MLSVEYLGWLMDICGSIRLNYSILDIYYLEVGYVYGLFILFDMLVHRVKHVSGVALRQWIGRVTRPLAMSRSAHLLCKVRPYDRLTNVV